MSDNGNGNGHDDNGFGCQLRQICLAYKDSPKYAGVMLGKTFTENCNYGDAAIIEDGCPIYELHMRQLEAAPRIAMRVSELIVEARREGAMSRHTAVDVTIDSKVGAASKQH